MTNSLKLVLLLCAIGVWGPGVGSGFSGSESLASDSTTKVSYFQSITHPFKLLFSTCGRRARIEPLAAGSADANKSSSGTLKLSLHAISELEGVQDKIYQALGGTDTRAFSCADKQCNASIKGLRDLYVRHARNASSVDEFLHWAPLVNLDQGTLVTRFKDFVAVTGDQHFKTWSALFTRRLDIVGARRQSQPVVDSFVENSGESASEELLDLQGCVDALIRKPDVNERHCNGWTLLETAILKENVVLTQFLLAHGADVTARMSDGRVLAMFARDRGREDLAQLLEGHALNIAPQ